MEEKFDIMIAFFWGIKSRMLRRIRNYTFEMFTLNFSQRTICIALTQDRFEENGNYRFGSTIGKNENSVYLSYSRAKEKLSSFIRF